MGKYSPSPDDKFNCAIWWNEVPITKISSRQLFDNLYLSLFLDSNNSCTSSYNFLIYNLSSIFRGKDSILNRLKEAGIENPSNYITFYGLRTHSILNSEPITELIYVHSKLMIVDDKIVICGSANINDRSLIGKRDSEVAVILEVSSARLLSMIRNL